MKFVFLESYKIAGDAYCIAPFAYPGYQSFFFLAHYENLGSAGAGLMLQAEKLREKTSGAECLIYHS